MALEQRPYYLDFTARLLQASFNFMFSFLGCKTKRGENSCSYLKGFFLKT